MTTSKDIMEVIRVAHACRSFPEFARTRAWKRVNLGEADPAWAGKDGLRRFYRHVTAPSRTIAETVAMRMQERRSALLAATGFLQGMVSSGLADVHVVAKPVSMDQRWQWTVDTDMSTDEINAILDELEAKAPGVVCDFWANEDGSISFDCALCQTPAEFDYPLPGPDAPANAMLAPPDLPEFPSSSMADTLTPTMEAQALLYQHALNEVSPATVHPRDRLAQEWEQWIKWMKSARVPKGSTALLYAKAWKGYQADRHPPQMSSKASSRRYIQHVKDAGRP